MNKIFIAIIMVLMFGCENKEIEKKDDILEVRTLKIVPKDINLEFSYPARLKSIHKVDIYARVEGLLIEQFFKEDSIVKEGEKLFKIDPTNYQNIVDRSKADLSNAEANFTKQKRDFERVSKLYKQGIFTIDIYDESKYNYENAKAQLKSARANLANALLDLSYTDIVASISGKVGIRNYDTMNLVGQNVNSVLTTITQLSPIYAEFSIPFSDFSYFNDTNNINITLSDDKSIKGKLDFIDSILDENTMTLRARAVLDNDDFKLLPIQFVYLNLSGFWVKNAISISQSAIGQDSNSSFVFVLENIDSNKEGSVSVRKVELGKSIENNEILINSGLKAGNIIIIDSLK
ncbi:MAG: efflux RND transporter periplasmic adaptor subunit [Helicobacteraceae bacterium]|nr:efflux RND transporter periplasmic adaptor subunit [Helicobacteraceae bacterium]